MQSQLVRDTQNDFFLEKEGSCYGNGRTCSSVHRAAVSSSASVICALVCTCLKVCPNTLSLFLVYPNTPHWKCVYWTFRLSYTLSLTEVFLATVLQQGLFSLNAMRAPPLHTTVHSHHLEEKDTQYVQYTVEFVKCIYSKLWH